MKIKTSLKYELDWLSTHATKFIAVMDRRGLHHTLGPCAKEEQTYGTFPGFAHLQKSGRISTFIALKRLVFNQIGSAAMV